MPGKVTVILSDGTAVSRMDGALRLHRALTRSGQYAADIVHTSDQSMITTELDALAQLACRGFPGQATISAHMHEVVKSEVKEKTKKSGKTVTKSRVKAKDKAGKKTVTKSKTVAKKGGGAKTKTTTKGPSKPTPYAPPKAPAKPKGKW